MQVERPVVLRNQREWRTGEEHMGNLPRSEGYRREIADKPAWARLWPQRRAKSQDAARWARGRLASWWGKRSPRRRSVAGLRGRSATLGLRTAQTPTGGSSEE